MSRPVSSPESTAVRHPDAIADRILEAIRAGRIVAGQKLGEQALAALFGVSRTLVREALGRLSARGMVQVLPGRGWQVVQPSAAEARDAFAARTAIEAGLLHTLPGPLPATALRRLKKHVAQERAALRSGDAAQRSYLLGDFHVCLAECAGSPLLAEILRNLTARTTLIAALYQSNSDARRSCADHAEIVAALEQGDHTAATQLLRQHIEQVAQGLRSPGDADDALASLRAALLPTRGLFTSLQEN